MSTACDTPRDGWQCFPLHGDEVQLEDADGEELCDVLGSHLLLLEEGKDRAIIMLRLCHREDTWTPPLVVLMLLCYHVTILPCYYVTI